MFYKNCLTICVIKNQKRTLVSTIPKAFSVPSFQFGQNPFFSRKLFFVTGNYLNFMNAKELKDNAFSVSSSFSL
jgi:hypothetical protein